MRWLCLASCVLMAGGASAGAARKPPLRGDSTLLYTLGNSVNGGLVGVVGPSLHSLSGATGLGMQQLGRAVLVNRAAKLLGTLLWTSYARNLQLRRSQGKPPPAPPHTLLACAMGVASLCAFAIGTLRTSPLALQLALAASGACYGFADSGMTLLAMWETTADPTRQRAAVARLNAGFTIGALLTPVLLAGSLWAGGSCHPCFHALAVLAAVAAVAIGRTGSAAVEQASASSGGGVEPSPPWSGRVVGAMALVLFCVTGCEHAVATWLCEFGHHVGGVPHASMAVMSSCFWAAICAGRLTWAAFSQRCPSGWLVLGLDACVMFVAALCYVAFASVGHAPPALLWAGTLVLAAGFASSIPLCYTLPAEAKIPSTPGRVLAMNLGGSGGEMVLPFLLGLAFERKAFGAFGASLLALPAVVLVATGLAWATATRGLKGDERRGAERAGDAAKPEDEVPLLEA